MNIINFQAENIKKLIAVNITPEGNVVYISGPNENGKTSVLDSIWWALDGLANIQGKPIREGQNEARIRLELGKDKVKEIVATRTFKAKADGGYTSKISVENAEGAPFPSPQAMLDELLGQLTFDPLAFARMKPKEQFDALRRFVPDVDFEGIESANKADYEKRKELNRKAKETKTLAMSVTIPEDLPAAPIDDKQLVDDLEKAMKHNSDIELRQSNRKRMRQDVEAKRKEAESVRSQIQHLEECLAGILKIADDMEEKLAKAPALPAAIDVSEIKKQMEDSKAINAAISARHEKEEHLELSKGYAVEADALSEAMERREQDKLDKIAAANIPVKDMSFGDGEILKKGLPFNQASDAEQLRDSIAIAMALNPKLRVIRVRDGSLMDSKSLKIVEEMAAKNDYQVWVERVDETGKVGFVLEDGHIKNNLKEEVF